MNIAEILAARADSQPDMPAIIEGRGRRLRRTTFAELIGHLTQTLTRVVIALLVE